MSCRVVVTASIGCYCNWTKRPETSTRSGPVTDAGLSSVFDCVISKSNSNRFKLLDFIIIVVIFFLLVFNADRFVFIAHSGYSPNSTGSSRLDTTTHDTFDVSSPCISACRTARLDTTSSSGTTRNLVMIIVIHLLFNVSYSPVYWNAHLFNLFHLTEQMGFV